MIFMLATSPIFLLVFFLFVVKTSLAKSAFISFIYTLFIASVYWHLPKSFAIASILKGGLITLDIVLIIFGAIFFLNYLNLSGSIQVIEKNLKILSPDRRIQAIMIAWLFGGFIEGTAGFGTPAAIVAPFLVAIGFSPMLAILVSLTANSTAVAFGAVGTPIRVGFAGLDTTGVPINAALINFFAGLTVPLMILAFVVMSKKENRLKSFVECLPLALLAGLYFLIPYVLLSIVGYELPSLLGSALGLVLMTITIKLKICVPKNIWRFSEDSTEIINENSTGIFKAVFPYLLLLVILLTGKIFFSGSQLYEFQLPEGIKHSLQTFNPGLIFLLTTAIVVTANKTPVNVLSKCALAAAKPLTKACIAIFSVCAMTQIMVMTNKADLPIPGILETVAGFLKSSLLPYFSTSVGALGSFLAGSATVSNLIFAPIQNEVANQMGFSALWILALQLVGAGAGNMIALQNILAVQSTVESNGKEREILGRLLLPCAIYIIVATCTGITLSKVL